jgi:PAS domain S-box-containing protein
VTEDTDAYRRLFISHPVAMAIWDPVTGRILAINDAAEKQYGYTREEAVGMTVDRLVHPGDWARLLERLGTMQAGHVSGETFRHIRRDGSVIEVEMTGHELLFDDRRARVVMALDVTDRRSLEDRLRHAQRMEAVGQLAGGIAHDFNNLLMAINGFSELLVERLPQGEELEAAQHIRNAGERAAMLTRQLLDFASPGMTRPEIVDVTEAVRGLLPILGRALGEGIELEFTGRARDPWVETDRAQLEQVVVNLAANARDAMPDGGRLTISVSDAPGELPEAVGAPHGAILITVADTGGGIDEAVRERIFLPFFTTRADRGGTGLGLATVFATVRATGGRVWVEPAGEPGTTIRVLLPRAARPPAAPRAAVTSTREAGRPEMILLAEDEPAVRTLIERVLDGAGYAVLAVPDGTAAIAVALPRLEEIDLLITDAAMPGMTGLQLARRLRTERPNLPVLFISGWASDAFEREWAGEPGIDLLPKPFGVGDLLARVTWLLGLAELQHGERTAGAAG